MPNEWPILAKPPVDVAIFQLKFEGGDSALSDFTKFDAEIRKDFPLRRDDYSAEVNLPYTKLTLGIAQVTGTSKTKVAGYLYLSVDQKSKLNIQEGVLTYIEEHPYTNWETFIGAIKKYLTLLTPVFENHMVTRTSIRFINRFVIDTPFNPLDFFKTTISTTEENAVPFPVAKYAFSLHLPIDASTYAIVKQDLDEVSGKVNYVFDIDVLNRNNLIFDLDTISGVLSDLRDAKNRIFFGNATDKLIESCN